MHIQPLARQLRPKTLAQIYGHDTVVEILKQSLLQKKIHPVYLFSGNRGVGKTTLARIIAKSLNCSIGITTEPCLACAACIAIEQNNFVDVIEIDGAAKTKVEDTRALLENVNYTNLAGRIRVYIIDEVHMLSNHSFNALLKTLEEPPEHVKFILATTEYQKIPATIISRCQHFHLRNFNAKQIAVYLQNWLQQQKIPHEQDAIKLISKMADGSMRDALTLLDQCLMLGKQQLTLTATLQILSLPQPDFLPNLLQQILNHNIKDVFGLIEEVSALGQDFYILLQELSALLHDIAIEQAYPESSANSHAKLFINILPPRIHLMYDIITSGLRDFSYLPNARHAFEMTILRLMDFQPAIINTPVLQDLYQPQKITTNTTIDNMTTNATHQETPSLQNSYQPQELENTKSIDNTKTINATSPKVPLAQNFDWPNIVQQLKLTGLLKLVIDNAKFISYENHILTLSMANSYRNMLQKPYLDTLTKLLTNLLHEKLKLIINVATTTAQQPPNIVNPPTAVNHSEKAKLLEDPCIAQIIDTFSAKITNMERIE